MANQSRKGVTVYDADRCFGGYTLFAHTYEEARTGRDGVAHLYLIDMAGDPVHEWTAHTAVQLPELLPNGDLLYSTRDRSNLDQAGLYKLAPDSSLIWSYHCRVDHDYHVMGDEHLMIHCLIDKMVPRLGPELRRHPYLIEIGPHKELLWEWHGEDHLDELVDLCHLELPIDWPTRIALEIEERLAWDAALQKQKPEERADVTRRTVQQRAFDWAHNNTCDVMPDNLSAKRDGRFSAGNILFSYRSLDIIGVIDRASGEIVWAWGPGELDGQHQPTMLSSGRILVYDNGSRRGWSRVIELDPLSGEVTWEYTGTPKHSFFAPYISGAQRLPNDNVLICEGVSGGDTSQARLFEVTRDKEIVWEFKSPYADPETIGIYRAVRYPPAFVRPLLE